MSYHLYILFSPTQNKYYIGHTGDAIEERLRKHNSNHKGFTGKVNDWKVVYTEAYGTKELAYARERENKIMEEQNKNREACFSVFLVSAIQKTPN
jgi:putative endonuclease